VNTPNDQLVAASAVKAKKTSRSGLTFVKEHGSPLLITAALLVIWEAAVIILAVPNYLIPAPTRIFESLISGFATGLFQPNIIVTLQEILGGFFIAVITAVSIAAAMTRWKWVERGIMPIIVALQTVPKVALAPLLLTWFGFGIASKIATTALLAFFPLLINIVAGLQSTDKERLDMFTAMGASEWQKFHMLRLPHALPYAFAGLKIAVVFSVIGAIVAEFVGSQAGLGYLIQASSTTLDVSTTFAVLVILSAIGMSLNWIISVTSRRVVFWEGKGLEAISGK